MKTSLLFFLIPALLFAGILYYFVLWNFYIALTNYSILHPRPQFVGLATFASLFSDPDFISSLERTLLWVVILVAAGNLLAILIASAIYNINSPRIRNIATAFFIYPLSVSLVASGIIWRWLFDVDRGIDAVLGTKILWLQGPNAFWSAALVSVWVYTGLGVLFYLAMFYNVDKSQIESAYVDGANTINVMLRVVIPQSRQALIIATVFYTLFSIQMFDLPYTMLFLNPFTMTLVIYTYFKFVTLYFATASATAIVVLALSAAIVIPYSLYGFRRWLKL